MTAILERVRQLQRLDDQQRSAEPPLPKSAKVELDSGCNLNCRICAFSLRPRKHTTMPRGEFVRIVQHLRSEGVEQLGLFYINEPFLCEWLPDAIRVAKRDCGYPYVLLTSNGLAATPERVRSCIEAGLDSLKFALDFHSPSQLAATTAASADAYTTNLAHVAAAKRVRDDVAQREIPRTQAGAPRRRPVRHCVRRMHRLRLI